MEEKSLRGVGVEEKGPGGGGVEGEVARLREDLPEGTWSGRGNDCDGSWERRLDVRGILKRN